MPINNYGVLKGRAFDRLLATSQSEHFQVLINRGNHPHRIAINTKSSEAPSQVLYYATEDFHHEITDALLHAGLPNGFSSLTSQAGSVALDFIRSNLFSIDEMIPLPSRGPEDNDDLNDRLDFFVQQAIKDESAVVYAFGQHWVDNAGADKYFKEIKPSTGIHDIHMNQGNKEGKFFKDNGVYQDGGLLFNYASRDRWAAVFTAFQSQAFHTDDKTGNPLNDLPVDDKNQPENKIPLRIIAAMVNPGADDVGKEYVILLNKSKNAVDLTGWQIVDKLKKNDRIENLQIPAGEALHVGLSGKGAQLSNKGGNITLLNKEGLKVDGVSYTKEDASNEGELIEL